MSKASMLPPGLKEFNKHVAACAELIKPSPCMIKLQVNTTGAWRNVLDFDAANEVQVLNLAAKLFRLDTGRLLSLRAILPGDTAPLLIWKAETGWQAWKGDR